LLGVAGATLAPSTLSLIRGMFGDPRQRSVAVGVWIASFSAGGAVGPLLGGVLLQWFWWGSVFLLAVPVMALLFLLGPILLPECRDPAAGRPDGVSALLSLVAVLAVIWGLKQLAQDGPAWPPVVSIAAGLVVGGAFVHRQRTLPDQLLDLRLFHVPAFGAALMTNMLSFFVGFGALLFIAQYLQLVVGLSPLAAGLWMVPSALGVISGSLLTPLLAHRVRPVVVLAGGLALAAVGFLLLTQVDGANGLAVLVTGSVVFSLGLAPVDTLAADLVVGAAPPERAGSAAALSETGAELGGALGIAILGVIGTAAYRGMVAGTLPVGVPPDAAAAARDTLGGAVAAAAELPDPLRQILLTVAQEAFMHGLHLAAGVSASAAFATAVLAIVLLRGVRLPSSD
jgi:DHA2 family multidrug resistance protein-like MFS transporter